MTFVLNAAGAGFLAGVMALLARTLWERQHRVLAGMTGLFSLFMVWVTAAWVNASAGFPLPRDFNIAVQRFNGASRVVLGIVVLNGIWQMRERRDEGRVLRLVEQDVNKRILRVQNGG